MKNPTKFMWVFFQYSTKRVNSPTFKVKNRVHSTIFLYAPQMKYVKYTYLSYLIVCGNLSYLIGSSKKLILIPLNFILWLMQAHISLLVTWWTESNEQKNPKFAVYFCKTWASLLNFFNVRILIYKMKMTDSYED